MDGMKRAEPPLEVVVQLIDIAATHVLRDTNGVAWRIAGYCSDRGVNLVNAAKSIYVKRIDGFTVERL